MPIVTVVMTAKLITFHVFERQVAVLPPLQLAPFGDQLSHQISHVLGMRRSNDVDNAQSHPDVLSGNKVTTLAIEVSDNAYAVLYQIMTAEAQAEYNRYCEATIFHIWDLAYSH